MQPAASIFKAYDIRGVVDETLTDEVVTLIGAALGLLIQRAGKSECVVGRDGLWSTAGRCLGYWSIVGGH